MRVTEESRPSAKIQFEFRGRYQHPTRYDLTYSYGPSCRLFPCLAMVWNLPKERLDLMRLRPGLFGAVDGSVWAV